MADGVSELLGVPVSQFGEKETLSASDLMLVSEYSADSDSMYYTDAVSAEHFGRMVSAQLDIQGIKDELRDVSAMAMRVSSDASGLSSDLYGLSAAFLSNDALTRLVPALSAKVDAIGIDDLSALRNERIIRHGRGRLGQYWLSSFAVNVCRPSGYTLARMRIPPETEGLSRHFTVRLSSDFDVIPAFYGQCVMYSARELPSPIPAGVEFVYDFKEISPCRFFVRAVSSITEQDCQYDED